MELTLPELNVPLLSKILTWAYADDKKLSEVLSENFPDWGSWDQGQWGKEIRNGVCQTAYCIAGAAVTQSGYALHMELDGPEVVFNPRTRYYEGSGRSIYYATMCYTAEVVGIDAKGRPVYKATGDRERVEEVAQDVLGLHVDEATALFEGRNSLRRVIYLAKGFAYARGVSLDIADEISPVPSGFYSAHSPFFMASSMDIPTAAEYFLRAAENSKKGSAA